MKRENEEAAVPPSSSHLIEVIVGDPTFDNPKLNRVEFLSDLRARVGRTFPEFSLEDCDIGTGSDWPAILLVILGVFFLGKRINDNLDAWIAIGKKLKDFTGSLKGGYRVNERGALVLAVDAIADAECAPISSLELIQSLPVLGPATSSSVATGFIRHPHALYTFILKVNDDRVYLVAIKSKGSIEVFYRLSTRQFTDF